MTQASTSACASRLHLNRLPRQPQLCTNERVDWGVLGHRGGRGPGFSSLGSELAEAVEATDDAPHDAPGQHRRRLIASVGFWCGSSSLVFGIATGHARSEALFGGGMLQVLYAFGMPALVIAVSNVMELWVDSRPSQMMSIRSIALKMKAIVEKQKLFRYIGFLAMVAIGTVGLLTFVFLDTVYTARIVNIVMAASAGCAIICINVVGVSLTIVIRRAKQTASQLAKAFHTQSIRNLWGEIVVLTVTAAFWITAVAVQELTQAGRGTPILVLLALMSSSTAGLTISVKFSEPNSLSLLA